MIDRRAPAAAAVNNALVVGAGMGGLSAGIALSKRGVRTTVIERNIGVDGTNIGINYRPLYALQELGVLDRVIECGKSYPVETASNFEAQFDAAGKRLVSAASAPLLGDDWTLPISSVRLFRPQLSEILKNALREHDGELLIGHTYLSLEPHEGGVRAELTNGATQDFDLVVGADGIHSGLRERFFADVNDPTYTGEMACRVILHDAPEHWRGGRHLAPDGSNRMLMTVMYPDHRFYLATGTQMERRFVEQDEARAIIRRRLEPFLSTDQMFNEIHARITDELQVVVSPLEWIFVPPPWHRGRIVLIGDAVHATAPTIGSAGGMALEDGVVLAQELAQTNDVAQALTAFAERRKDRAKLVVEISAELVRSHHEQRPHQEETVMRHDAFAQLIAPY